MNRPGGTMPGRGWAGSLAAGVALAGLVLLFFNRMAFSNLILARGDTLLYFYPYWTAAAAALQGGRVPLWNPDIFMGVPFLANSQAGFFYPLNWPLWLLVPTPWAVNGAIMIHIAIAGWGAYLAGRRTLALERVAAWLAAALFALGGYLTAQVEHINQLQGLAWLPWFFVAVAPIAGPATGQDRRALPAVVVVGALFALQLLAGHTQTAFISGVAVALWLFFHALGSFGHTGRNRTRVILRPALVMLAGAGLAALIAAVQLLPTIELTGQSSRQGGLSPNEVLSFSWNPLHLTRSLLPGYGQSLFSEYVAFLPLTALALAFAGGWVWRRNPAVRPWLFLLVAMLLLALGRFTPLYHVLSHAPGFDLFRAPARWLAVAALAAALLAGHGWQRLYQFAASDYPTAAARDRARRDLVRPLVAAGLFLALVIAWGYAAGWPARFIPAGSEAPFEYPHPLTLLGWLIEFALGALLLWVILGGPSDRARRATRELIVLMLAALWLGSRGLPYNQLTTPEAYFDLRPPQARLVALATCAVPDSPCIAPPGRFLSLSGIFFDTGDLPEIELMYADQLDPQAIYDYVVAVKHKEVLSPNLSMIAAVPSIDGFDGGILPLRVYSEAMRLILPDGETTTDGRLREFLTASPEPRWMSLFNGRYLITDKTGDVWRDGVFFDQQHPVEAGPDPVEIAAIPAYEATEIRLIADGAAPDLSVRAGGETWAIAPQAGDEPGLYTATLPQPATLESITLRPCAEPCLVRAMTLVDGRDGTFQPLTMPPYRLIFSGDVKIYENLASLPRAFVVHEWQQVADESAAVTAMRRETFDPAAAAVVEGGGPVAAPPGSGTGEVDITHYSPESVSLRVTSDVPGLLVLTDAYYPGWEATVDGRPATIVKSDVMFRGVFIDSGEHEVVFRYRPQTVRVGAWLSAMGVGLLIIAVVVIFRYTSSDRSPARRNDDEEEG
ncbi:MAG: YfhO family protein [Anaerolineae bacterium]|nr:YfhO family protein [Anaerolineae bacterium]